ncbi:MAG: aminopeptidase [Eubacteriaceae bacterium]|jgi:aminopeptidase|nr:aminopeptidase [Eubacteriaceae bacterium]
MDERINKLSNLLVNYSTNVQPGEKVLIDYEGEATKGLVTKIVDDVYEAGGIPFVRNRDSRIMRSILMQAPDEQIKLENEIQLAQMKQMNCYIKVKGTDNVSELSDVPGDNMNKYLKYMSPTLNYRVNNTKWVILRYPNHAMAQLSNSSLEAFEDFYFDVCTLDYEKMGKAMEKLVSLMNRTDKVRITGPGTDLRFSIKGIPAVKCAGTMNIPDGEVYTAPVRESMNGTIAYNTPSEQQGFTFENIRFLIKDGRIVEATANDTERINKILDTDEGARYFGEFSFGINPYVLNPMKDTLFDEKISGSIHLTPGQSYEDAPNGNDSAIHWDLVLIQREDFGGGEIYFDDQLIRKDGRFVIPELACLNPENLN